MRTPTHTFIFVSLVSLLSGCIIIDEDGKNTGADTGAGDDDDDDNDTFDPSIPDPLPGGGEESFSGDVDCDNPISIFFEAEKSEIIELHTALSYVGPAEGTGLPYFGLYFDGEPVLQGSFTIGMGSVIGEGEIDEGRFRVNLTETGTYELSYTSDIFACGPNHFETTLTRVRVAQSNLDQDNATLLDDGTALPGTLGCNADERWHAMDLEANETVQVDFGAASIVELEDGSFAWATIVNDLFDAAGQPVMDGGLQWSIGVDSGGTAGDSFVEGSRELTVSEAGTYFLKSFVWNGCTISDTYVRYHTL